MSTVVSKHLSPAPVKASVALTLTRVFEGVRIAFDAMREGYSAYGTYHAALHRGHKAAIAEVQKKHLT